MQLTGTFSREDNKTATIYAFCAFCSFSAQSIILREVSDDVSATAIVGLRSAIAFLVLVPLFVVDRHSLIPRRGLGLLFLRALFTGLGMTTATIAITRITLTSFTLFQMSEVFFTMTLATLFLKERIRARQWWGIIIGSFGVLLVLRPGAIAFSWWDLLALSSAFFLALSACLFRLGRQAYSIAAVLFWQNLGICVIFLPAGIVSWHTPSAVDAGLLAMLSLMQAAAQVLYARAIMTGAISCIAPLHYTRLVIVAILAYLIYQELPSSIEIAGALVICLGTWWTIAQGRQWQRASLPR